MDQCQIQREHEDSLEMELMEEVLRVLFILGLRVSILSVLALDDARFSIVFQRWLIFSYTEGDDPMGMGYRIGGEYVVRGRPNLRESRWFSDFSLDSEMDLDLEAPILDESLESHSTS